MGLELYQRGITEGTQREDIGELYVYGHLLMMGCDPKHYGHLHRDDLSVLIATINGFYKNLENTVTNGILTAYAKMYEKG